MAFDRKKLDLDLSRMNANCVNPIFVINEKEYWEKLSPDNELIKYRQKSPICWKDFWQNKDKGHRMFILGSDGKYHHSYDWIYDRKVRVHVEEGVRSDVLERVALGLSKLIEDIGIGFEVVNCGSGVYGQLIKSVTNKDGVDFWELGKKMLSEENGNAFILNNKIKNIGYVCPGRGDFALGLMAVCVSEIEDRNIAPLSKHEGMHLFGHNTHCDISRVRGYDSSYNCNCHDITSLYTCEKCLDGYRSFWKGVEENTGLRFFK